MSTKIYNGMIIRGISFPQLHEVFISQAAKLRKVASKLHYEIIGHLCVSQIDAPHFPGRKPLETDAPPFIAASRQLREQRQELQRNGSSEYVGIDASWSLFPQKGQTLVLAYAQHPKLLQAFKRLFPVKEYGYWDNTDKPSHISKKDWEARKKDWEKALPGIGVAAESGWTMDLWSKYNSPPALSMAQRHEFVRSLNSRVPVSKRARAIAEEQLLQERMKMLQKRTKASEPSVSGYLAARQWLNAPKGQEALEHKTRKISKTLAPFTYEALFGKPTT